MKIACVAVFCLFAIWHANGQDYANVDSTTCESNGKSMILTKEECETAAISLGLSATSAADITGGPSQDKPSGCIFTMDFWNAANSAYGWLAWYDVASDVTCGSLDTGTGYTFNCICKNVDPCEQQCETCEVNGGCEQTCENVNWVAKCSCTTGYSLNEDGKKCDPAGSGSAAGSASSSGEGSAGSGSAAGSASSSGEGSAPATPTFGLCNNPIPNRGKAKGRCPWKYPMLQRYSHSKQGDVCLTDPDLKPPGPELKKWKCPRGCKKVKRPPFCENEEGDACRVPLPGGGPSEETSATCNDNIMNQDETDVDCGGSTCLPCHCFNNQWDTGEIHDDCGGPCPPCEKK